MLREKGLLVEAGSFKIACPPMVLTINGLGSCVAVALYDVKKNLGGMIHFILPENPGDKKKEKYADSGIPLLLNKLIEAKGEKENIVAKMVGGAVMFPKFIEDAENSIGKRNVRKAREILENLGIKIVGEDTGGDYGRSVSFELRSGKVFISSYKNGDKVI
ncbi:MAG: chemotaxis protein CheD [candidate division WOR-3 bacterium]